MIATSLSYIFTWKTTLLNVQYLLHHGGGFFEIGYISMAV